MGRSALGWLNILLPRGGKSKRIVSGEPFGSHPRQKLDVYAPRQGSRPFPVLFFIYGGGWDSGEREDYEFAGRAFAAAGYVTVIADYRVGPEFLYPVFVEDGAAALDWVVGNIADYGGDPARLFLMGHSAGAYNAVMLGLVGQRFGVPDLGGRLKGVVGLSGPYDFYPFDVPQSIAAFSHVPEPEQTQPINLVNEATPPMCFVHGRKDVTCGPYHSERMAKKLAGLNRPVRLHMHDDLAHAGVLLALLPILRWRAPVYQEALDFMHAAAQGDHQV